jgi:hypothetical protein
LWEPLINWEYSITLVPYFVQVIQKYPTRFNVKGNE